MLIFKKMYEKQYSLVMILSLLLFSELALSQTHYLQPGQNKNITLSEKIRTVFIAKDSVANYEIIGENNLIIYAKSNGLTGLIAYDENDKIILDDTIVVDPILSQVIFRINRDYPNSKINITKYAKGSSGEDFTYVVSGNAPDTETKTKILSFIGSLVGTDREKLYIEAKDTGSGGIGDIRLDFLDKHVYTNIIDKIDVIQETQINVKLTFVEVSKDFTDSLGIEWQSLTLGSMTGSSSDIAMNSIGEFTLLGLKKGFDIKNITTVIRAISNDKLAKVLAEPNLSVLSGETASFLVGGEIPVVSTGKNGDAIVTYKEYGIRLLVAAKVHNNKRIRLFLADEFSTISGSYSFNNFDIPTLRTRKTSSTIDVADGDSFVIAGLINEQDEETLTKIPFLGDLPILGALARSSKATRGKTELVVFATVNIVNPQKSFELVELPVFERTEATNLFLNVNNNMDKQKKLDFPITNESEKFVNQMGFIE